MHADAAGELERAFEVDGIAGAEVAEVAAAVGLGHDVCGEAFFVEVLGGEVDAVDGDAVAEVGPPEHHPGADGEIAFAGFPYRPDLFNDAGEHGPSE